MYYLVFFHGSEFLRFVCSVGIPTPSLPVFRGDGVHFGVSGEVRGERFAGGFLVVSTLLKDVLSGDAECLHVCDRLRKRRD